MIRIILILVMLAILYLVIRCMISKSKTGSSFDWLKTKSKLKPAFLRSREENNIAIALTEFWNADVYIVLKNGNFWVAESEKTGKPCVTVTEAPSWVSGIDAETMYIKGNQVINAIDKGVEIIVVYETGGDYLTEEHVEWIKSQVKDTQSK